MYPVEWAAKKDVNPRRGFEKARIVARMSPDTIHSSWPFPDADDLPSQVKPAVLLPHTEDRHDPPLCFVDFDDVRDPYTGETSREAVKLIEALGGYTEISRSGMGLHTYVRASLPDGLQRVLAPLEDVGSVEIYDRSRFIGGTWGHVDATPPDHISEAQTTVTDICRRYSSTNLEESDEPELRERARERMQDGEPRSPQQLETFLVDGDVSATKIREHVQVHGLSSSPSYTRRFR